MITAEVAQKVLDVVDAGLVCGIGEPVPGQMCVEAAVCYALGLPHGDDPACVSRALRGLKIRLNDSSLWSSDQARAKGLRRLAVAQLGSAGELDDKEFVRRLADLAIRKSVPFALRAVASHRLEDKHKAALLSVAARCEKEGTKQAAFEAKTVVGIADAVSTAAHASADAATAAAATADAAYAAADAAAYAPADAAAYAATAAVAAVSASYAAYTAVAAVSASYAVYTADATVTVDKLLEEYAEDVVQILIEMKAPGCQWLDLTEEAAEA
jgi:hypothetical protein